MLKFNNPFHLYVAENNKRVLIVDDEAMIRNVVVRIMKIKGHHAVEAESGDAALDILQSDPVFDYVILDLSMPGKMTGDDTFTYLRKNYPDLKVIISSGFISKAQRNKYIEDGAEAILEKPYKTEQILELIV